MSRHSGDLKAASIHLTEEMTDHINRSRWSKGRHQLPIHVFGYSVDLDGDGTFEKIVGTGEGDPGGSHSNLILRIRDGKAEILGAFRGSFGVIPREGGWADIVAFEPSPTGSAVRIGLRFDGSSYVRTWRYMQTEEGDTVRVGINDEATTPGIHSTADDTD